MSTVPKTDDSAFYNYVGPDYLRTLGIPLVAGREFQRRRRRGRAESGDCQRGVSRREFKLGRDAVGKRMQRMGRSSGFDIEIVGVAANSAYDEVKAEERSRSC